MQKVSRLVTENQAEQFRQVGIKMPPPSTPEIETESRCLFLRRSSVGPSNPVSLKTDGSFPDMVIGKQIQAARGAFVDAFVRYGSGADRLRPVTQTKWWNTFSWVMIVVGLVGWAVFIFWPY